MNRIAFAIACTGFVTALAALAQAPDFTRNPPPWQKALEANASPAAGKAIAASGKGAAIACAGCHGANGIAPPGVPFPRLAGLPVEYVAKQLFDYRDGTRPNAIMAPIAKALTDAEIASLARHFAGLPVPATALASAPGSPRGHELARVGDNTLAIPACIDCHGSDRGGGGPILPPLGQSSAYTTEQLRAFRSGERRNDADGVMRAFAKRLSDGDIEALARYYATR